MFTAILVGGSLGIAGVGFQALFRNQLADPYIIGASSGAAFGVTLAIVLGWQATVLGLQTSAIAALVGSLTLVAVVMAIGTLSTRSGSLSLLLAGVALSSMINSMVSLLMFWNEDKVPVIFAWLMGSLASNDWHSVASTSIIAVVGLFGLWSLSRPLDAYLLGDVASQSLGLDLVWFRVLVIAWFIPRAQEPQVRRRPGSLKLIYRISKFSPLSGISLDWLTVTHKKPGKK